MENTQEALLQQIVEQLKILNNNLEDAKKNSAVVAQVVRAWDNHGVRVRG